MIVRGVTVDADLFGDDFFAEVFAVTFTAVLVGRFDPDSGLFWVPDCFAEVFPLSAVVFCVVVFFV